ncbi:hypothetical protein [Hymenobacter properus]|uniref:Lipoprotein n=1 Tax=Hymenobacter properus TaxID=2791026 RepID=A0A931BMY8_9BACT|nr:hypothetical protein [Hymenobacter properus]MBF9143238.1 hypothetical protein [Hymenobacter properus]MBR7722048.1 hypothetical protein [Microvirga sp. SRT04]
MNIAAMKRACGPPLCLFACAAISLACGCRWFDTEAQLQQLYAQSDAVLVGQAVAALGPRDARRSPRFLGDDVLVRVIAWKKGPVRRDTVVVLQADGNCNRPFVAGDTVYVFARAIRGVQALPRHDERSYSYFEEAKQVFYKDSGAAAVQQYREWARRFPAITTNQCTSFTKQHRLVPAFFRALKEK